MASMPDKGSMGLVQSGEGRMALAVSKPTAIACKWASLDKGTLMGMYIGPPTVATQSLFLPLPLLRGFFFLDFAYYSMVRTLAKPTTSACPAEASSRLLADRCLWLPSAANAATPAPYLANSLSLPYFKYANIWIYGMWRGWSWTVSRWAILSPPRMVM